MHFAVSPSYVVSRVSDVSPVSDVSVWVGDDGSRGRNGDVSVAVDDVLALSVVCTLDTFEAVACVAALADRRKRHTTPSTYTGLHTPSTVTHAHVVQAPFCVGTSGDT